MNFPTLYYKYDFLPGNKVKITQRALNAFSSLACIAYPIAYQLPVFVLAQKTFGLRNAHRLKCEKFSPNIRICILSRRAAAPRVYTSLNEGYSSNRHLVYNIFKSVYEGVAMVFLRRGKMNEPPKVTRVISVVMKSLGREGIERRIVSGNVDVYTHFNLISAYLRSYRCRCTTREYTEMTDGLKRCE